MGIKIDLKLQFKDSQKGSQKVVEMKAQMGIQSEYSGSRPAVVDCQKDSGTTGENGTQVKPVLLAVKIFAVYVNEVNLSRQNPPLKYR